MKTKLFRALAIVAAGLGLALPAHAQWQTQAITIKPGWSAIFVHVDASYDTLDDLVGADLSNPITEIWMWQPAVSTAQYVTTPQSPTLGAAQWANWERISTGLTGNLNHLTANAAYLVHSTASGNYTWNIKGKPQVPIYNWTTTGENFVGFPTVPGNAPRMDAYLSLAPSLVAVAEVYQYQGGDLSTVNPSQVFAQHATFVNRGQAFWIRAGSYFNNYFGPFTTTLQDPAGVNFGDSSSSYSFHIKNTTASSVTVTMKLIPSETPPAGQTAIVGTPPMLVRGALITSNLTYTYTNLNSGGTVSWTLPPQGQNGSDFVVVVGLNRYAMNAAAGATYAGILQLTDSYGYTEADLPVSAQMASYAGLWVGQASVSQVQAYLKSFQLDGNNNPVVSSSGSYVVTNVNTDIGPTSSAFPLRLIVHNNGTTANLLERVFFGLDPGTNSIITTSESFLAPTQLGSARRISAVHLPVTAANAPYQFSGVLKPGGTLTTTVNTSYDDQSSNPFLHTYHPDHDNLDARFQTKLPVGSESFGISRQITLSIVPPGNDFGSLTQAGQTFNGAYAEAVTLTGLGGFTRTYNVAGVFSLNRISSIAVLTH